MPTSNGYVLSAAPDRLGRLGPVPAPERSSREALSERLVDRGYLYLTGLIDPQVVQTFRAHYFRALAGTGLTDPDTDPQEGIAGPEGGIDSAELRRTLFRDIVPGSTYNRFCATPQIKDWFTWFLGGDVHLHRRKIIRHTRPNEQSDQRTQGVGAATQAHYDLLYLREGSDQVLSMWIPLGPCPTSLGGLIYLENSHHWVQADEASRRPRRPAASITADLPALADEHDARWLYADYAAGDVMVHTAHLVHAALDNVDPHGRLRLSTDIRYQLASEHIDSRWQRDWHDRDGL